MTQRALVCNPFLRKRAALANTPGLRAVASLLCAISLHGQAQAQGLANPAASASATPAARVSTQCAPDAPAHRALDALLRAYERGDVAFLQQRLDPAMIGYGVLINSLMIDNNLQRQTRVQVLDRQMQCGPDVAVVDFAWEKYFLSSTNFTPNVQRGRGAVLISGLGEGLAGQWRISGLVGDNIFLPSGAGADGSLQASASASYGALASGCTTPAPALVTGFATASATAVATVAANANTTAGPPLCFIPAASAPSVAYTCSVSAAGVFGATGGVPTSAAMTPLSCTATGPVPNTGSANLLYAGSASQSFSGVGGSTISLSFPALAPTASGIAGADTLSGSAPPVGCNFSITLPTVPAPAPVCTGAAGNLSTSIEVRDADLQGPSVQVQVQASNGDSETLSLPQVAPGVYRLNSVPVTRGASAVRPGSGRIELVGAAPGVVSLTIRYSDAKTASGTPLLRQTTMLLTP